LIEGYLIKDPQLRLTPKGTICDFTIVANRFSKNEAGPEKEVSFFDVEAYTKLAESINAKGRKGRRIRVAGRLKQERWTDSDGKNYAKIIILAEYAEFLPNLKNPAQKKVEPAGGSQ
jgi:single-strand DNA-binding protein